ncbi:MAG: hypothetical protein LC797_20180 [Chloroflexi bacterium]|nr:hypothetical protein [Chloroflexota bacterium]
MHAGDHDPEQAQESQDQERIIEPQPAACINTHQNTCSVEHPFGRKIAGRYKRITRPLLLATIAVLWLTAACLPDPQRGQSAALLDQLVAVRATLGAQPLPQEDACNTVGDVQSRLSGEPGLPDVHGTWPALRDAARALQAVCGQSALLTWPATDSVVLGQARQRWGQGIQREIGIACDHLRAAASALDRAPPC